MKEETPAVEIRSLRQELKLRILLQNLLLQVIPLIFAILAAVAALNPAASATMCFVFQCVMLSSALQWCHHGVRTRQIKQFLTELDTSTNQSRWEHWLPAHRPETLLGSRWLISTKGVYLGLGASMLLLNLLLSQTIKSLPFSAAVIVWGTAVGFLLTNPKE